MRYLVTVLLILSFCSNVFCQEDEPRLSLPSIETTTVLEGVPNPPLADGQYKCLAVSQWSQVIAIALEYRGLYNWRLTTQGALDAYNAQINAYELTIKNLNYQIKREKENGEYYKLRLGQVEKAQHSETLKSKIERFVLYGVILGELVIISTMGIKGLANQ
jgi:hypothetical protein